MNSTYSITSKFQVTIPKEIREQIGITNTDKVSFERRGKEVVIKRIPSIAEVRAILQADLKRRNFKRTVTQGDINRARENFHKKGMKWE